MKCPTCDNQINIKLATKIKTEGCKVLTSITSIFTVQCLKCKALFQLPLASKDYLSINKDR